MRVIESGNESFNVTVKVLSAPGSERILASAGVEHEILELEAGDKSGFYQACSVG